MKNGWKKKNMSRQRRRHWRNDTMKENDNSATLQTFQTLCKALPPSVSLELQNMVAIIGSEEEVLRILSTLYLDTPSRSRVVRILTQNQVSPTPYILSGMLRLLKNGGPAIRNLMTEIELNNIANKHKNLLDRLANK